MTNIDIQTCGAPHALAKLRFAAAWAVVAMNNLAAYERQTGRAVPDKQIVGYISAGKAEGMYIYAEDVRRLAEAARAVAPPAYVPSGWVPSRSPEYLSQLAREAARPAPVAAPDKQLSDTLEQNDKLQRELRNVLVEYENYRKDVAHIWEKFVAGDAIEPGTPLNKAPLYQVLRSVAGILGAALDKLGVPSAYGYDTPMGEALSIIHGVRSTLVDAIVVAAGKQDRDVATSVLAINAELLDLASLFQQTIEYSIRRDRRDGDDEGARLKTLALHHLQKVVAKAEQAKAVAEAGV